MSNEPRYPLPSSFMVRDLDDTLKIDKVYELKVYRFASNLAHVLFVESLDDQKVYGIPDPLATPEGVTLIESRLQVEQPGHLSLRVLQTSDRR